MIFPAITKVYAPGYEPGFTSDALTFLNMQILGIPGMPTFLVGAGLLYFLMNRTSHRLGTRRRSATSAHCDYSGFSDATRRRGLVRRILRLG